MCVAARSSKFNIYQKPNSPFYCARNGFFYRWPLVSSPERRISHHNIILSQQLRSVLRGVSYGLRQQRDLSLLYFCVCFSGVNIMLSSGTTDERCQTILTHWTGRASSRAALVASWIGQAGSGDSRRDYSASDLCFQRPRKCVRNGRGDGVRSCGCRSTTQGLCLPRMFLLLGYKVPRFFGAIRHLCPPSPPPPPMLRKIQMRTCSRCADVSHRRQVIVHRVR